MKPITVRGVRSVDIEMSQPERVAEFYSKVWNLTEVERKGGSIWFRGTGPCHYILAIHPAQGTAAIRRMVTASRPSASASATAAAAIAPRLYRAFGPRPPCSGSSQIDVLISNTSRPGARAYRRALYVVCSRQQ